MKHRAPLGLEFIAPTTKSCAPAEQILIAAIDYVRAVYVYGVPWYCGLGR
jgi:hypothetical protein